jgi:hypothetical protein
MLNRSLSICCYEDYVLLGCIALFCACLILVSWLAIFSILMIGAMCSSETSGSSQTTRRYNEEPRTIILSLNTSLPLKFLIMNNIDVVVMSIYDDVQVELAPLLVALPTK